MLRTRGLLPSLLLALFLSAPGSGALRETAPETQPLRLGVSSFSFPALNFPIIEASISALDKALKGNLTVSHYKLEDLLQAIQEGKIDLVLSSSGFYRRVLNETSVRDLATAVHPLTPNPNKSEGSAFIVLSGRKDLNSFKDLKGKILAANMPEGFSGYQIAMGELVKRGYDYEKFFAKEKYIGYEMNDVIELVRNGKADVGILRSCYLESLGLDKTGEFKVIEPRKGGEIGCLHSTDLYPNWTFSLTPTANQSYAGTIVQTLLNMPPTKEGLQWQVATDYSAVDKLFKDLKIGPYRHLREWTFQRFLSAFWPFILLGLFAVGALVWHNKVLDKKVWQRTFELANALALQKEAEKKANEALLRLESIRSLGSLSHLSSLFAHEIRQPLGTISFYARALTRLLEKKAPDREMMGEAIGSIKSEVERINRIVDHVRGYAKNRANPLVPLDLSLLVEKTAGEIALSRKLPQKLEISAEPCVWILGDAFQLELILINLVQNASDACSEKTDAPIQISVFSDKVSRKAVLEVVDSGPSLSEEKFAKLSSVAYTSKKEGLGLGLSLVRSISEIHHAELGFKRLYPNGLSVSVAFPLFERKNAETAFDPDR